MVNHYKKSKDSKINKDLKNQFLRISNWKNKLKN